MKLESGRRVYVPSTKTFGNIVRRGGILGLKESYALIDDLGKRVVYMGKPPEFVYVDTGKTVDGIEKSIPEDIVHCIREKLPAGEAAKKTKEFYQTPESDREEFCKKVLSGEKKNVTEDKRPSTRSSRKKKYT